MRPWILQTLQQDHHERRGGDSSPEAGEQLDLVTHEILIILLREAWL